MYGKNYDKRNAHTVLAYGYKNGESVKMSRYFTDEGEQLSEEESKRFFEDFNKQKKMPKKYKLPTFDCPNPKCDAKNILFAGSSASKNETVLEMLEENGVADYVIICPKCK